MREAVLREVEEEAGVRANVLELIGEFQVFDLHQLVYCSNNREDLHACTRKEHSHHKIDFKRPVHQK